MVSSSLSDGVNEVSKFCRRCYVEREPRKDCLFNPAENLKLIRRAITERVDARCALVEGSAKGKEIRTSVNVSFDVSELLRWRITRCKLSKGQGGRSKGRKIQVSCKTKVQEPESTRRVLHDIVRLHVPMNDPRLFSECESFQHVEAQPKDAVFVQRPILETLSDSGSVDSLLAKPYALAKGRGELSFGKNSGHARGLNLPYGEDFSLNCFKGLVGIDQL